MKKFTPVRWIALLFLIGFCAPMGRSQVVGARMVDQDLCNALGIQFYRFEAAVKPGQSLVVKITRTEGEKVQIKSYFTVVTGNKTEKLTFPIVLIDSGNLHPSLKNTYMLREGNIFGFHPIENVFLGAHGNAFRDGVEFAFFDPNESPNDLTKAKLVLTWTASIEKYSDVEKRWMHPTAKAKAPSDWPGSGSFSNYADGSLR